MSRRGPRSLIAAAVLLAALLGGAWFFHELTRGRESALPAAPRPLIPRPVPAAVEGSYQQIQVLQRESRFAEAASLYVPLLGELEASWGAASEDLALYHYNHALALKLAGERERSIEAASRALARWPGSLPLLVAETTGRAELACGRGAFDPHAHRSFAALLEPDRRAALEGMNVLPGALAAQWADMLLKSGRPSEALEAAVRGLAFAPSHRGCREIHAKVLLALHREREAIPILEALGHEQRSVELDLLLGIAVLNQGDAASAWRWLEPLLAGPAGAPAPGADREALGSSLHYQAGRALNQLGRHAEAAERLLEVLARDPENPEALHQLSVAARGLGAREGAEALARRTAMLSPAETARDSEEAARRAGEFPSAKFYAARRCLATDRTGEALRSIEEAIALAPAIVDLRLEEARIRLLLGRTDQAERALRSAFQATRAPECVLELARLKAREGNSDAARALLAEASTRPGDGAARTALRARALLEMGAAEEALNSLPADGEERGSTADARLVRAEAAIAAGRHEEASDLLDESYLELPGGSEWARALEAWSALRGGPARPAAGAARPPDPSDLLDHPRLLRAEGPAAGAAPGEGEARLAGLRALHERRLAVLQSMRGHEDGGVLERWRELCDLYAGAGALRKAREAAWYIVQLSPGSASDWKRLARTLSAPEESVARLAALRNALRLAPGDEEAVRLSREARAFLGLDGR